MTARDAEQQIVEYLREQGLTPPDIDRVLARLRDYDHETSADSVFDSIASGDFDLAAIVQEVLGEDGGPGV